MECPKCGKEVKDDDKICPHCKKVLKLVCPKCNTANPTPVCTKCGFVILSKCEQCGAITPTIKGKCSKCGFSTYKSVAMASSNIDQFACVTLDFANLDEIKEVINSKRLIEKFIANLDSLVVDFCNSNGLKREIMDGTYIIRFNKSDSFTESAQAAIIGAIDLAKEVIMLNFKLMKAKAISIDCKLAVLKRTVDTVPENYKAGFDIKLVSNFPKELKYLNGFQIITDSYIYQEILEDYSLNSLSSNYVYGEMVAFFELNLKKHLKVEPPKEEEEAPPVNIAQIEEAKENLFDEHEEMENKLYNKDVIVFDDMKCAFLHSTAYDVDTLIANEIAQNHRNIFMVKSNQLFRPDSDRIITRLMAKKLFAKSYKVNCYASMKFKPYGFFYELFSVINNLSRVPKLFASNNLNNVGMFDNKGFLKSFLTLSPLDSSDEPRSIFLDILDKYVNSLGKVLIYINDFEYIDDSSYEILKFIWKMNPSNITFIVSTDMDSTLHKAAHFLLQNPLYAEIRLKPLSIKHIVEVEPKKYSDFANSYYFTSILQGMKGSYIFFKNAIAFLKEKNIIEESKKGLSIVSNKACVIPPALENLMKKRVIALRSKKDAFNLLCTMVFISPMSDLKSLQLLGINNLTDLLKYLVNYQYITISENNISINNYEILKKALDSILNDEEKQEFITQINSLIYSSALITSEELSLNHDNLQNQIKIFEHLSSVTASLGDFSAYLNCSNMLMKLLNQTLTENKDEVLEEQKLKIFENVSNMLNNYTPRKIYGVSKNILSNLEKSDDLTKLVAFSIKMLKTSMTCGNYNYTIELVNKVLAKLHTYSINPDSQNFNISYFIITLIRIEALFSIGKLRECEELGNEIVLLLKSPNLQNQSPDGFTRDEFENVIFNAMTFVGLSKVFLLRKTETIQEFINELKLAFPNLPAQFDYFFALKNIMLGKEIDVDLSSQNDEKFAKIIKSILRAFTANKDDFVRFANDVYEAKICANINDFAQLEILFDLLIGFAYFKLGSLEKAKAIYSNVLEISDVNGFKLAGYVSCYLLSMLYYGTGETETALGLANNTVSHIEKDNNVGDYLFYLFRVLTSGIYMEIGNEEAAAACVQSAAFVKKKDEVVFGLEGVDIEVEERRINDRRKVKQDVGGRRNGQRRITDDMKLVENMPQETPAQAPSDDFKMSKDAPKEEVKKNSILDDMKKLEGMQAQAPKPAAQKVEYIKIDPNIKAEKEEKDSDMEKVLKQKKQLEKEVKEAASQDSSGLKGIGKDFKF